MSEPCPSSGVLVKTTHEESDDWKTPTVSDLGGWGMGLGLLGLRPGYQLSCAVLISHLGLWSRLLYLKDRLGCNLELCVPIYVIGSYCSKFVLLCSSKGAYHMRTKSNSTGEHWSVSLQTTPADPYIADLLENREPMLWRVEIFIGTKKMLSFTRIRDTHPCGWCIFQDLMESGQRQAHATYTITDPHGLPYPLIAEVSCIPRSSRPAGWSRCWNDLRYT